MKISAKSLFSIEQICELVSRYKTPILILGGLNTTNYGIDFGDGKPKLHILLKEVSKIPSLKWIEVECIASSCIYPELIDEIEHNPKIVFVNYFLQSGSNKMLQIMNIGSTVEHNENVLKHLEQKCISSAIVVGHPGEGEEELKETIDFIKRNNLWYLTIMKFINSVDTPSNNMKQLSPKQYQRNYSEVQKVVDNLAHRFFDKLIGQIITGFVDQIIKKKDGTYLIGVKPLTFHGMIDIECNQISCKEGDKMSVEITKIYSYEEHIMYGQKVEVY